MFDTLEAKAKLLLKNYTQHQKIFATAESCTGGLISAAITAVAGSSQYFDRAFITYTNQAKMDLLQVQASTLEQFGAVSVETAKEMVAGAIKASNADIAVAVTGIAGPSGGSKEKPVGTVCIAFMQRGSTPLVKCHHFTGDRSFVREQTVLEALDGLLLLSQNNSEVLQARGYIS